MSAQRFRGCDVSKEEDVVARQANASRDRLDSSKGYEENNVQFVCKVVNLMKHEMTIEELEECCRAIIAGQQITTEEWAEATL